MLLEKTIKVKIKRWIIWGLIFLACIGYAYLQWSTNPTIMMNNLREDFAKMAEEQNREMEIKENRITEFYQKADNDLLDGISYIDSILEADKTIDKWEISNLHTIVGETLYDNDSIKGALERFELSESISISSPRSQVNKAGCYVKMGDYETAMKLLISAAEVNHSYKWYIGNLYEVMNKNELAFKEYNELHQKSLSVYQYCGDRIIELEKDNSKQFTELVYRDRRKKTYILLKPSDPNSNGLDIGKLEIEKK